MAACFPPSSPSPPASPNPLLVAGQQSESSTIEPPPRSVSIDDVLRLLDGCLAWLQSKDATETVDRATLDELILRVTLRIVRFLLHSILSSPLLRYLASIGLIIHARPPHFPCTYFSLPNPQSSQSNQILRIKATFTFVDSVNISSTFRSSCIPLVDFHCISFNPTPRYFTATETHRISPGRREL